MSISRVTVSIPSHRSHEIKAIAAKWREAYRSEMEVRDNGVYEQTYSLGGDAKAISRIAFQHFGGYREMFVMHDWPERGSDMMRKVQSRVKERYGSIANFERQYPNQSDDEQPSISES